MGMAAKKLEPEAAGDEQDNTFIQFNVRVPRALLQDLDAWLAEENARRRYTKLNRSEMIRLLLTRALDERPDLGGK